MLAFRPALLDALRDYDAHKFGRDLGAGVTVGIVALPLAIAFAIASGVKPEAGIFTAIIAGFLISALGGSRVQIGGPAGAFIVIIYGIVARYGLANLLIATIAAGALLFAMGAARLGGFVRFIPVAVVIGFTNGIAVLIALSQVRPALGLQADNLPADFVGMLGGIWRAIGTANPYAIGIFAVSLALVVAWPKSYAPNAAAWRRWVARVPGTIVVLVLTTLFVTLAHADVETIGSKFGGIPRALPAFALPAFSWETVRLLLPPTITIALLGAIESLLCARVADELAHDRHDPNQELMAQGVANFVTPFFGGIPATGTIARTVTNIRSGAATPVAGIVHAATLLAIVLAAAPLAENVPLAALAGILAFVAYNMGEWREFARLRRFNITYRTVLLTTFFLTVVFDLTIAVEVGLALAALNFIYRMSSLTRVEHVPLSLETVSGASSRIEAHRVYGTLFFGAVGKMEGLLDPKRPQPKVMILDLYQLVNLDSTGLDALEKLHASLARNGSHLVLAGVNEQPRSIIERSGFADALGRDNLQPDLSAAVSRAKVLLAD
ncbi:MAG: SulP family inorganic anion transporter [Burkholderiales bacterium]|nr:SulP family inorganic anion transporter [Burkholderiales bacterium]